MKLIDEFGNPSHPVLAQLITIQSLCKQFLESLQKSVGIDVEDLNFIDTFATFSGNFLLPSDALSTPIIITAVSTGPVSNAHITGTGTNTIASLVGALPAEYTITGDATQVLKLGENIQIYGGVDAASDRIDRNIQQERFAELIAGHAAAIKTFYNGL